MGANVIFPTLYKRNYNNDVYYWKIEIENDVITRTSGKLDKKPVKFITRDVRDSVGKSDKFYGDKINEGYRAVILNDNDFDTIKSFFPTGNLDIIASPVFGKPFMFLPITFIIKDTPTNIINPIHIEAFNKIRDNFLKERIGELLADRNEVLKPMKAKPFKINVMPYPAGAQHKLNGVRCTVHYYPAESKNPTMDLFYTPVSRVDLISREGIVYNVPHISRNLVRLFENGKLNPDLVYDGEIYFPGLNVATIAGAAKNIGNPNNSSLIFVIFDISDEMLIQHERTYALFDLDIPILDSDKNKSVIANRNTNVITNKEGFIFKLDTEILYNDEEFIDFTNESLDGGFEGGILRNLSSPYMFGSRRNNMLKLKRAIRLRFIVLDVVPMRENPDQGMMLLKNDTNNETFECNISTTFESRRQILKFKDNWIGKKVVVKFYERTINDIPFHANVELDIK